MSSLFAKSAYAQSSSAGDILWDKIISIEPLGSQQVYDIEVEATHNFVAQGIVAHNTYQSQVTGSTSQTETPTASSAVMLTYFKNKLTNLGFSIDGLDEINPVAVAEQKMKDTQWYLFEMPNNRYLELFLKDNDYVAYGLTTPLQQNTVLRFQSFEKNAGKAEYWAEIYKQRVKQLKAALAATGKNLGLIGVPTDQILSEARLVKRVRGFLISKGYDPNTLENTVKDLSFSMINKIRAGIALDEAESQMAEFKDFPEYRSFGPAADFYVNKLKFTIVPTMAAPNKFSLTAKETGLLNKLKSGEHLSEVELIGLFGGRGLVQTASSAITNPAAENLPDLTVTDKASQLFESSDTIQAFGEVLGKITFNRNIGISDSANREQIRSDIEAMSNTILNETNKLLTAGLAKWKAITDASILVPGDIVKHTWKNGTEHIVRYNHSNPQKSFNLKTGESQIIGAFHYFTYLTDMPGTYSAFSSDDIKEGRIEVLTPFDRNTSLSGIKFRSKEEIDRLLAEHKAGWIPLEDVSELGPGDIISEVSDKGERLYRFEETVRAAMRRLYGYDTGESEELFVFDMNLGINSKISMDKTKNYQRLVADVTPSQSLLPPSETSFIPHAAPAPGGIDLSQIELTLKDEKYISSLNPADLKVLRAAKALKDEWDSLSLLYVHEIILLLKDTLAKNLQNKDLLLDILHQLKVKDFLDSGALQFFNLIQSQKSSPNRI